MTLQKVCFIAVLAISIPSFGFEFFGKKDADKNSNCESFKEFRSSYEFLLDEKDLSLPANRAVEIATQIAAGCTGSFDRFKSVFKVLKKSGVDLRKAAETSLKFSKLSDEKVENFILVFKRAFLENYLDLDFATAFKLAHELSEDTKAETERASEDFVQLAKFCSDQKNLTLPVSTCAQYALTIAKLSSKYPSGVFSEFHELYTYLRENRKTGLNAIGALNLAPKILAAGPGSANNFIQTYEYSTSDSGLKLKEDLAMNLALKIVNSNGAPIKQ